MKQINLQKAKALLCSTGLLFAACTVGAQTQKGEDIDGKSAGDQSGVYVSMPNAETLAVGAWKNDLNGTDAGHVRVFIWNGARWVQKGEDIEGESAGDYAGRSVSMPNANTLAVGGPGNDAGHVRIYIWNGSAWVQKGLAIDGEAAGDRFGISVCMPDSNTLAIGATLNDGNGMDAGHVRVFKWNDSVWVQKGSDVEGEFADDLACIISMSDANTLAVGAPYNDKNGTDAGHVRVFRWNGSKWEQKGLNIDGDEMGDMFGWSVILRDSNTLAAGAVSNDKNGINAGLVRVFLWNGSAWVQKGLDVLGEKSDDFLGFSVSMPSSNMLAVGGPGNDAGHVRIYIWNGSAWVQKGLAIDGEAAGDRFGISVCMPDSNTLAIGAFDNDGNGTDAGHVRVYTMDNKSNVKNSFGSAFRAYPNPTPGELNIDLGAVHPTVEVTVRNALGQVVMHQSFSDIKTLQLSIPGEAGLYMVEVTSQSKIALLKVMKK